MHGLSAPVAGVMIRSNNPDDHKRGTLYLRMETDDEYRKRCCREWCYSGSRKGVFLDEHIESVHGSKKDPMQRKMIEDGHR